MIAGRGRGTVLTLGRASVRALPLVLLLLGALARPAQAQLNVTGQWSTTPYLMPSNPIHAALLRNGKVLIVSGSENNYNNTTFKTAVWDPVAGTFATQLTPWDLFCNGLSFLPDGRVIMTGGNLNVVMPGAGPPWTTIFDPVTEEFYQLEDMAKGRWYASNAALADGTTMVFGGLDEQENKNNTVEIYDVGLGWSPPFAGSWSTGWYPRMHVLPNGKVFVGAPNPDSHTFDPSAHTWTTGSTTKYGIDRQYGASVLLPLDPADGYKPKVMIFGGDTTTPTATVELIDLGVASPAWVTKTPMPGKRVHANATLLPNGKILVSGGSTVHLEPSTAHLNSVIYDPKTDTYSGTAALAYPKIYHSTTLLLPDGTVYAGGSNPGREIWDPHIEIYKPPYLFTSTGAPAPRPVIGTLPAVVGYGQTFTVGTTSAASIGKVVLMRPGANSHSFDMEQRLVYLSFTKGTNTLSVVAPPTTGIAPPGYYMLFILDGNGVPSVAKFLQLIPDAGNQPPAATITSPPGDVTITAGQSVSFASTATDADGSVAVHQWSFPGGSPRKSTSANPGAVTFATPGVYTVSLTVLDNLGANNPSPPTVTVTVNGAAALGAAITSPASGATVSGIVTVGMSASNAQGSPTQFLLKLDNATTLSSQSVVSGSTATYSWNTAGLSGSHTLNLTVTDGAGRTATAATTVTIGAAADTTPPTVTITAPASGATVSGTAVTVSATAADNVGVIGVQFKVNGGNLGTEDTTAPFTTAWNTTLVADGSYTLTAVARDAAGNATTSAPITVTVANGGSTPPSGPQPVVWTSAVNVAVSGSTITKSAGCDGCFDAGAISQQTIASGDGAVEFKVPAGVYASAGLSTGNAGTTAQEIKWALWFYPGAPGSVEVREGGVYKADWPNVAGAVHKIAVEGGVVKYSLNGTLKYTSTVSPTYPLLLDSALASTGSAVQAAAITTAGAGPPPTDTTPPVVSVTAPASGASVAGTVTVSATATDNVGVASVQFQVNGTNLGAPDTTAPYSIAWDTSALAPGSYTLTAVATDAAGNSATSAPVTVTKPAPGDTTPPTVSLTAPAGGATVTGTVTVSATATDNVAVASVQFKLDGANLGTADTSAPYSVAWNTAGASGTHTLTAVATDTAGNTTTSAPVTVTIGVAGPQPVVWTNALNVGVSGNTITKNAGCDGCFDAGAVSQQMIVSGDGSVEFQVSAGSYIWIGLNGGTAAQIGFGLRFYPGTPGIVEVREAGVYKWDWQSAAGAVHKIAVEGGVVKYSMNGVLKYTSTVAPTYPLLLDARLGSAGSIVQNAMITTAGGGSSTPPPDTTPPVVSLTAPAGGATVSGTVTLTATASDDVAVAGVQFMVDGVAIGTADSTTPYSVSWDTSAASAGSHTLTAVATDTAGNATTSAPVTVTVGGGTPPATQPVTWASVVNATVSGSTITKSAGCDGCFDAGAVSQQTIASGDGSVSFSVSAGSYVTVGLTDAPAAGIAYALRFYPGTPGIVEVRESGVYKADWAGAAGAVHKIAIEGGAVKYYLNGTLQYTSTLAPTYPLAVDALLGSTGSAVQSATLGP